MIFRITCSVWSTIPPVMISPSTSGHLTRDVHEIARADRLGEGARRAACGKVSGVKAVDSSICCRHASLPIMKVTYIEY